MAPLSLLGLAFARQVTNLIQYLRQRPSVTFPSLDQLSRYPVIGKALQWVSDNASVTADQLQGWLTDSARSLLQSAASMGGNVLLGVVGTVVGFFLTLFLLFFLLRDGRRLLTHAARLIPLDQARRTTLVQQMASVLRAVFYGTVTTAVIQGALVGVGFAIVKLPSPVVFGVLAALASFIPVVGSMIVLVPAMLYLVAIGRWGAAVFLIIWSILIAIAEQLLRPLLSSRHGEVSTLAVFMGALGGVQAFGFIGLLVGPVLLSLIVALVRLAEDVIEQRA
jgi:predicted PurR-regulated permease PerM